MGEDQTSARRAGALEEDMMDQEAALGEFRAADAFLEGHFLLSSGLRSSVYIQCARVMMDPARGERLCRALAAKLRREQPSLWAGEPPICVSPAMGGVIVGYETARALGLRSLFVEREDGAFQLRRGFELPKNTPCLMIEDVVTTGKSSLECLDAIRAAGARPVGAACLVNRSGGTADLGLPLTALVEIDAPLYEPTTLPPELQALPPVKPGSRKTPGGDGKAGDGSGSEGSA